MVSRFTTSGFAVLAVLVALVIQESSLGPSWSEGSMASMAGLAVMADMASMISLDTQASKADSAIK